MKNGYEKIDGLDDFYDKDTEILICGTIVGNSSKGAFYYLGNGNSMYKFIDRARGTQLENLRKNKDVNGIKKVLHEQKIGFCDALSSCERKIGSSSDKDIDPDTVVLNKKLEKEIGKMPKLKKIILNGCSESSNKKVSTMKEFDKLHIQQKFPKITIEAHISTSNSTFGYTKEDKAQEWDKALN